MAQQDLLKAILSKRPTTINKATLAEVGLGATTLAGVHSMYTNTEDELEKARRSAKGVITRKIKTAGAIDELRRLFLKRHPEFSKDVIEIKDDGKKTSVTVNGPHSIFSDTKNAIMTIKDDPGNHKKKALAGVAGALAGAYVAAKNMTLGGHAEKLDKALEVDSSKASKLNQVIADVSQWLLPASVYYTSRNLDRDSRAIAGTAATVGAHKINQMAFKNSVMKNQNIKIPPEAVAPMMRANAGMATAAGSTLYALHQFQAAADEAELTKLKTVTGLGDAEKAKKINAIRSRRDFLTRYPVFRSAPYSEKMRGWYNRFHKPVPKVTPEDYKEYFLKAETNRKDIGDPLKNR